jgi:peptide methionine sulfoxide reductase MsrB
LIQRPLLRFVEDGVPKVFRNGYLGAGQKGLYVSAYGGLPLFSSGNVIDTCQQSSCSYIRFSEPCDPSHIKILRSPQSIHSKPQVQCARSLEIVGWIDNGLFYLSFVAILSINNSN